MPPKSRPSIEPREVPEVWSSEPDPTVRVDPEPASSGDGTHALADEPSSSAPGRARGLAAPVLVTLAAAALAFLGMRVIIGGALERLGVAPSTATLTHVAGLDPTGAADATSPPNAKANPPSSVAAPAPAATSSDLPAGHDARMGRDAVDAGASAQARASQPGTSFDVKVSTELLDPPPQPKLFPGHGLLEVRTWEPQRIYVDGVFVGNYASRLVPLNPGTYHVRLLSAERDIERAVQVQAGRRTRVWARTASGE
jgi:hypothetical protein